MKAQTTYAHGLGRFVIPPRFPPRRTHDSKATRRPMLGTHVRRWTVDVDLETLSDQELNDTFDQLCAQVADAEAGTDERREWHLALMLVTQEMGRRTDAWIAQRSGTPSA